MSFLTAAPARIALAGCGAVGSAVLELVARPDSGLSIDRVLVRDLEKRRTDAADGLAFTADLRELLESDADVVVEVMGGIDSAADLARATLRRGACFVTANKALIAARGPELESLAQRCGGDLRFDATVGGGVPVVRSLRDTFAGAGVTRISGVLNGTANYLLTQLEEGVDWTEALAAAQAAGYAEADPSRDLDGRDVADKAAVLAWVAWGVEPEALQVTREGLPADAVKEARAAVTRGLRLRLVADLQVDGSGSATADILCREVPAESDIGRTRGVGNTVLIETSSGDYTLSGPGAGGGATALAVLADVRAAVARGSTVPRGTPA